MNSSTILVTAFPALLILAALLAPRRARRDHSRRQGTSRDAAPRLERMERREDYEIRPVPSASAAGGDQYFAKWSALQAKFDRRPADGSTASNGPITEPF